MAVVTAGHIKVCKYHMQCASWVICMLGDCAIALCEGTSCFVASKTAGRHIALSPLCRNITGSEAHVMQWDNKQV